MNLTTKIISQGREATREELLILYSNLACDLCPRTAHTIKRRELARLVIIELFFRNVFMKDCNAHLVRHQLSILAGVSKITIKRWTSSVDFDQYARYKPHSDN